MRHNSAHAKKQLEQKKEIQQERGEQQLRNTAHQQNIQSARQQLEEEKAVYLERLMETDMSDAGIQLLDNMVDPAFILGNISDAEYHDAKWYMQTMYVKIRGAFPVEESCVTGDIRAFVLDDRDEDLDPLTDQQRIIIAQMIKGVTFLFSRSKDGFQQEMNVKSISVSEIMDGDNDEDDSVKLGLFGG
jgi:hypothetical protein